MLFSPFRIQHFRSFHKFDRVCQHLDCVSKSGGEWGTGAFTYALSADEISPALAAPRHAITALFSCRFKSLCPSRRQRHFHGNADRTYNYTLLRKVVCQKGRCPLWILPQEKTICVPLRGLHIAFSCLKAWLAAILRYFCCPYLKRTFLTSGMPRTSRRSGKSSTR